MTGPDKRGRAVAHPLVDDATRWWRSYLLAEDHQEDSLRRLADGDDDHAQRQQP
jgi:hypothetical protein